MVIVKSKKSAKYYLGKRHQTVCFSSIGVASSRKSRDLHALVVMKVEIVVTAVVMVMSGGLPRNLHFKVHEVLHLPQNLHFKAHKVLHLPRNLHFKAHKAPHLPQNLLFKVHQVLHLPRNLHFKAPKYCTCHEIYTSRSTK